MIRESNGFSYAVFSGGGRTHCIGLSGVSCTRGHLEERWDPKTWAQEGFLQVNMPDYAACILAKVDIGIPEQVRMGHFQTNFEHDGGLEAFAFVPALPKVQVEEQYRSCRLRRSFGLGSKKFVLEGTGNKKGFDHMCDLNLRWMFVDAFDAVLGVPVLFR